MDRVIGLHVGVDKRRKRRSSSVYKYFLGGLGERISPSGAMGIAHRNTFSSKLAVVLVAAAG